jgi:hypothetical protein
MKIPPAILAAFPPTADLLLDVARRQVDDAMLLEIAQADHMDDANLHLAALRTIRDDGVLPSFPQWVPREVLGLVQWPEPEIAGHQPGSTERRGHQMRAFACAALLRATADEGGNGVGDVTLANCLVHANVLGEDINEAVARFLTWAAPRIETDNRWLFALGLLIVATRLRTGRIADRDLGDTAAMVLLEEAEYHRTIRPSCPPPTPFGLSWGFWRPLAAELIGNAATIEARDVRKQIEFIGEFVLDFCWHGPH